jgi:hypothetical protein
MVGGEGTLASPWGAGRIGPGTGRGRRLRRPGVRGVSGQEQDEGDACVPSPLNPTPAPTERHGISQKTYQ